MEIRCYGDLQVTDIKISVGQLLDIDLGLNFFLILTF